MTGKVIDSSANRILILILPIAFLIVVLVKAWPFLLALLLISISWIVWQQYQWKQWSQKVNPFFNQLIKENQGCLTPLDLSVKANLSGAAAKRYLEKRAEEFGAQRRVYEDKGPVYYFLTASALGSIFDNSEPTVALESVSFISKSPKRIEVLEEKEPIPSHSQPSTQEILKHSENLAAQEPSLPQKLTDTKEIKIPAVQNLKLQDKQDNSLSPHSKEDSSGNPLEREGKEDKISHAPIIQAELAKRLEVHSSTVGKRKTDPDFSQWSQSKDPDGIAWEYLPDSKEFLPRLNKK
ncbi:MAG: hypothetical protein F6K09_29560 [Merismopedia sp. SIO2A8]|nr:hypothetical protein [Symploca sp. SIO2B6]NET52676.1 hypothetical protein [Merismopedia sp. SIO2A8]